MAEQVIRSASDTEGLRTVCLRYFNAADADSENEIDETYDPETHLIPNLLLAALDHTNALPEIYGDYGTPDGTCIRGYIHIEDLCQAHLCALDHLDHSGGCHIFNVGSGSGYSVAEVLDSCRAHCNGKPVVRYIVCRAGDPAILIAGVIASATTLQWQPTRTLDDCVSSALAWHRSVCS